MVEAAVDRAVSALAHRQGGQITHAQLLDCGITDAALRTRVARGHLVRLRRGVYALAGAVEAPWALERAALLALGDDAWLRHPTASAIWGIGPTAVGPTVYVAVLGPSHRARAGLCITRVQHLQPSERRVAYGLRLTSPARTVLDHAAAPGARRADIAGAIDVARNKRLLTSEALRGTIARNPHHRGITKLRAIVADDAATGFTRSEAERRLRALCREAGLPPPRTNVVLLGCERDFVWPDERLVVEVDGFATHGTRAAFEQDRARDRRLVAAGWLVIRLTWRDLTQRPMQIAAEIAGALARRRAA